MCCGPEGSVRTRAGSDIDIDRFVMQTTVMKGDLQDLQFRHKRYDNIDGTGELLLGSMFLGFALLGYLQTVLPAHSIWRTNGLASLLFMYAVLFPVMGGGFLIRQVIKRRITWPRTGYVAFGVSGSDRKAKVSYWSVLAALGVFSALIAAGLVGLLAFERRHLGLVGVGYAGFLTFWVAIYAFWVWRMGREHPWKWLVLIFMALGLLVIGLRGPGTLVGMVRPVLLFVGVMWVLSGVGTLGSYLRHTRLSSPELE